MEFKGMQLETKSEEIPEINSIKREIINKTISEAIMIQSLKIPQVLEKKILYLPKRRECDLRSAYNEASICEKLMEDQQFPNNYLAEIHDVYLIKNNHDKEKYIVIIMPKYDQTLMTNLQNNYYITQKPYRLTKTLMSLMISITACRKFLFIHGDLKPHNTFVSMKKDIREIALADYGCQKEKSFKWNSFFHVSLNVLRICYKWISEKDRASITIRYVFENKNRVNTIKQLEWRETFKNEDDPKYYYEIQISYQHQSELPLIDNFSSMCFHQELSWMNLLQIAFTIQNQSYPFILLTSTHFKYNPVIEQHLRMDSVMAPNHENQKK